MTCARIAVAVSGGRDSMALLHCLGRAARDAGTVEVWALHVHHGLMPEADAWAAFVAASCRRWRARGLPLHCAVQRLEGRPQRGDSVEAWARAGRYAALAEMARSAGCSAVALAHHRGDQAETFLLQALRGAGPAGLSAMPSQVERNGIRWLRPWLAQPREAIEAYVRTHRIAYVDDASNTDARFARNRLRREVMPALRAAFPGAEAALAQACTQAGHARALIDEVALSDLALLHDGAALRLAPWRALSPARRREALRAWLRLQLTGGVGEALLDRLCTELPATTPARWPAGAIELRRYRGRLSAQPSGCTDVTPAWPQAARLHRLGRHAVPGASGTLQLDAAQAPDGVPQALLRDAQWQPRTPGLQFQRAPRTPPRSLKKQFQDAAVPAWQRDVPVLVAADGRLLFVPGLGTDARALAEPGMPRRRLSWQPADGDGERDR